MFGLAVATGTFWLVLPPKATAQVSATDFNAVKEMVQKLSEQVQSLSQSNLVVQQMHEKDQEKIKELEGEDAALLVRFLERCERGVIK